MKTKSRPFAAVLIAMTFIVSGAITLPELPDRDQMTVKGYVHDGTNPIGGVYVTDGFLLSPPTPMAHIIWRQIHRGILST